MATQIERFWAKVRKSDGCWEWLAGTFSNGYGQFKVDGAPVKAHRFAWELHNGAIPEGLCVCHHCDVRACVRPDHMFLGTDADNMADRDAKGRQARQRGVENGQAKLTEEKVRAIRRDIRSQEKIAVEHGVSQTQISRIKRGERWAHLLDPAVSPQAKHQRHRVF